jgi:hypothetical protein
VLENLFKSPLAIGGLSALIGITGWMARDRLGAETRDTASVVRIEALDRRMTEQIADSVSKRDYERTVSVLQTAGANALTLRQFEEYERSNDKRLDEIALDVRQIRETLNGRGPKAAAAAE